MKNYTKEELAKFGRKKKSVLHTYIDLIRELRAHGISYCVIADQIRKEGQETSAENVRMFCIRQSITDGAAEEVRNTKKKFDVDGKPTLSINPIFKKEER